MSCAELFRISATIVADEFIDKYMPEANGDYVKVYLYLLKNHACGVDIAAIAEALHLTEGDVRRAVRYWEERGILCPDECVQDIQAMPAAAGTVPDTVRDNIVCGGSVLETEEVPAQAISEADALRSRYRRTEGKAVLNKLNSDDEFVQLLFIVQKYRSKILTESEQEVIAYLYDGLKLPCEVIDYLVAYCVETGHNSMRYIEKTGLDWATAGISDAKAARRRTEEFEKLKNKKTVKTRARKTRQGITRETNLDDLVKTRLLQNL